MSVKNPDIEVGGERETLKEQAILVGLMFSFMAYGFLVLTFILCLRVLSKRPKSTSRWIFNLYVWTLFIFITAYMSVSGINKVQAFTTYRRYPGGPSIWMKQRKYTALSVTGNLCAMMSIWLSDGFLLYRVVVVYTTRRYIIIFPSFLYAGTIGAFFIFKQVQPSATLWTSVSNGLPYLITASLCNISTVLTLASRLFLYRHLVRQVVGKDNREHDAPYGSALTILVESAALHAAFSTVFVVSYALKSPIARVVVGTLCNVRGISSFLIILRVARQTTQDGGTYTNTFDPMMQRRTRNTRPESFAV